MAPPRQIQPLVLPSNGKKAAFAEATVQKLFLNAVKVGIIVDADSGPTGCVAERTPVGRVPPSRPKDGKRGGGLQHLAKRALPNHSRTREEG
ncbi:hypothetical protein EGR_06402 [Echinococcus granulosus]|uniref:Uncharacterized protein n=1 Tax=Echinococcus granulosus TaxID=6210 RepID=W6UD55_ECHGR|nr:hypothetical protein EGR_06402 [Echinococcus granulosus]EUB58731.1 hypothetical protein EGR_06402 [Echinococcus granulosus]